MIYVSQIFLGTFWVFASAYYGLRGEWAKATFCAAWANLCYPAWSY